MCRFDEFLSEAIRDERTYSTIVTGVACDDFGRIWQFKLSERERCLRRIGQN